MINDTEKSSTSSLPALPMLGLVDESISMSRLAPTKPVKLKSPAFGLKPTRESKGHLFLPALPLELTDNWGMILPDLPLKARPIQNEPFPSVNSPFESIHEQSAARDEKRDVKPVAKKTVVKQPNLERVSTYLAREKGPLLVIKPHLIDRPRPITQQNILSLGFNIATGPRSRWCKWATERFFDLNLLINSRVYHIYFEAHPYSAFNHYLQTTRLLIRMLKHALKSKKRPAGLILSLIAPLPPPLFAVIFETQYQKLLDADQTD